MAVLARSGRRVLAGAVAAALAATLVAAGGGVAGAQAANPYEYGVSVYPEAGLVDGQEVELTLSGRPGELLVVTQCRSSVGTAPSLDALLDNCGNDIELYPTELPAVVPYTVRASFPVLRAGSADVVTCGAAPGDCILAVSGAGAFQWAGVPIEMTPAAVVAVPDRHLAPGSAIEVAVTGEPGAGVTVAQCVRPVAATRAGSQCGPGVAGTVGPDGAAVVPLAVAADVPATGADEPTACRLANCAVAAFAADGARLGDWRIGLAAVPVTIALDRTSGLLDGDRVLVEASGLEPGGRYTLLRCDDVAAGRPTCEHPPPGATIVASPSGRLSAPATVAQRFSELAGDHVCRAECGIAVVAPEWPVPLATVGYEMAAGALAASPATGLTDGRRVTLTGTGLMSSYAGPAVWIVPTTGQWVLGQCAAAVGDAPTLAGVFRHCAGVPGAGPVDVPVSDATVTAPARAGLTTILGDAVDCTVSAGACALVLTRLEQDGSVSLHDAPLSFA